MCVCYIFVLFMFDLLLIIKYIIVIYLLLPCIYYMYFVLGIFHVYIISRKYFRCFFVVFLSLSFPPSILHYSASKCLLT